MYNKEIFNEELDLITDNGLRLILKQALVKAPSYFYTAPASSSGKYHPEQDLGEGGIVRHTKTCIRVGLDLLNSEQFVGDNDYNRDIIIASLMLHDIIKNGFKDTKNTVSAHPLFACSFLYSLDIDRVNFSTIDDIVCCIKSHMGKWNKDREGNEMLPTPQTQLEKLVHLADYIASRKYIDYMKREDV